MMKKFGQYHAINNLKLLFFHIVKVIRRFDYVIDYKDYSSGRVQVGEFYSDDKYIFALVMNDLTNNDILLKIKKSISNMDDIFSAFIVEYLKNIKGIRETASHTNNEFHFILNVDKCEDIIGRIIFEDMKENFDLYKNLKKYNL
jgi:hypothetical protein